MLDENEIYSAKLAKDIDLLTKTEAIRWFKSVGLVESFTINIMMPNKYISTLKGKLICYPGEERF